jgi:copper transport protein
VNIERVNSLKKRCAGILIIILIILFLHPSMLLAHASLIKSFPQSNSLLITSPKEISLTFNERLEISLYYIKVINDQGQSVTSKKAQLDQKRTTLALELPKLADGTYITTYHIISADGHPIEGSYLFTIGTSVADNTFIASGGLQQNHSFSWGMSMQDWLLFLSRIFYYLTLLILLGWVMWAAVLRSTDENVHLSLQKWRVGLLRAYVIALIFLVYYHYQELIGDGGPAALLHLFTETSIGVSWLASFILAFIGFIILQRKLWIDLFWIAAMIAVKCLNGHAMAFKPISWTLGLDAVHIAAAALWVGGLAISIVLWRNKSFLKLWLPHFSRAALWSIIVLTVTGSITTWLYLPKLTYLKYSQWGTLLLIKVGLVLGVAITGFWIRKQMRKRKIDNDSNIASLSKWLKVDLILMIAIVSIVGLLTYAAPIPRNDPFNWHEMGEKAHLTLNINPNVPGVNTFDLEIWLPNQEGSPKQVELLLKYKDDQSIAPISIPLQAIEDKSQVPGEYESFDGFVKYVYKSEGPYLAFAGKWGLELNIYDAEDNEISFANEMRVY